MKTEDIKNVSEAVKNFQEIIEKVLQPRGIDLAIMEGHTKIIENFVARKDVDDWTKMAFLSSYKKAIKELKNCTSIADIASNMILEDAKAEKIEEDWFAFFFDKARLISDEVAQNIWAKVLAGEVNNPGCCQRTLLHILSVMNTSQAKLFCNIASFCMYEYKKEEYVHPFIFISKNVDVYEALDIHDDGLLELENLGLIQCDFKDEFVFPKKKILRYGNHVIEVYGDPENEYKINVGNVRLTRDGQVLFKMIDESYKTYNANILDFIVTKLKQRNCKVIINNKLAV